MEETVYGNTTNYHVNEMILAARIYGSFALTKSCVMMGITALSDKKYTLPEVLNQ
jgi:hydroxylamine reductase (hybrid-cluster protein)